MEFFTFEKKLLFVLLIKNDNLDIRSFLDMVFDGFRHAKGFTWDIILNWMLFLAHLDLLFI